MTRKVLPGLNPQIKDKLIRQVLERRLRHMSEQAGGSSTTAVLKPSDAADIPEQYCRFDLHPGYQQLRIITQGASRLGVDNPFFRLHDGTAGPRTRIEGKAYLNFASYNYLGLAGHPSVNAAAKDAIDRYGTSVSASRIVSGERAIHRQLEQLLATLYGVEDCVVFVSGHATNVSTIGHLFGPRDLIVHDTLVHNSVLMGAQLSGACRRSFPHNDVAALDALLAAERRNYQRTLIVAEGIYSMDGDYPDLPALVEIKRRHRAFLMIDEAHSFGVMGATGLGIREHFGIEGTDVDIWMGTLSKALAGCGGYIAGSRALVEHLKFSAPGFIYSVGMPPPVAAAAVAALGILRQEPERVRRVQDRGQRFLNAARGAGIDTGYSAGVAVIPVICGSSIKATRLANAMFERGINVQPILYPAVEDKAARLRFFVSSEHAEADVDSAVEALTSAAAAL